jgi:hypothetical protein
MSFTTPLPDSKINQCTRNKLGEAIYLLAHIIRKSDWKTGKLRTSQSRIASETGFPEATVKKWMQKLVDVGEIICEKTLNGSIITIRDYSPIARTRGARNPSRSAVNGTKFGPNERPEMNPDGTTDGPNHVIRILFKFIHPLFVIKKNSPRATLIGRCIAVRLSKATWKGRKELQESLWQEPMKQQSES